MYVGLNFIFMEQIKEILAFEDQFLEFFLVKG